MNEFITHRLSSIEWGLIKTTIYILVSVKGEEFFSTSATVRFSRKSLLYWVSFYGVSVANSHSPAVESEDDISLLHALLIYPTVHSSVPVFLFFNHFKKEGYGLTPGPKLKCNHINN